MIADDERRRWSGRVPSDGRLPARADRHEHRRNIRDHAPDEIVTVLWTEHDGARLFATDEGAGPPIVLLPGPMGTHSVLRPFVTALAPDHRVLVPDLRGSGRSWYSGLISFDKLADDVRALLDVAGEEQAIVGGISGGAGVAVRTAIRHAARVKALILITPAYGGARMGLTQYQRDAFEELNRLAKQAPGRGVNVLAPLYERLPPPLRERALSALQTFDAGSVAATARFLASGDQPFDSGEELRAIAAPALVVRGDDAMHPAAVSDLHVHYLADVRDVRGDTDAIQAVSAFVNSLR